MNIIYAEFKNTLIVIIRKFRYRHLDIETD